MTEDLFWRALGVLGALVFLSVVFAAPELALVLFTSFIKAAALICLSLIILGLLAVAVAWLALACKRLHSRTVVLLGYQGRGHNGLGSSEEAVA